MTAAVMSVTTPSLTTPSLAPPTLPKRHGFSIESLIGKCDSRPSSPASPLSIPLHQPRLHLPHNILGGSSRYDSSSASSTAKAGTPSPPPQRPIPLRPSMFEKKEREDRLSFKEREAQSARERELREIRDIEARERERDIEMFREREHRERELVIESMREKELQQRREIRDREQLISLNRERDIRERDIRDFKDNCTSRDGRGSNPASLPRAHSSPRSLSPQSPRLDKSVSPEMDHRISSWPGEQDFRHLLGNIQGNLQGNLPSHLDSNSLYSPLRMCNRALASMNGLGPTHHPAHLGMGVPPHLAHLQMNPLLYNLPRDLGQQTHPLLAARYPGFMHPRYPMGPPPGLLFHPYRKPKRNRTAFSPSQLLQLEQAFEKNHYVVGQERKALASKLQLTETQVKVWFQNRRTKHKRMKAEEDGGSSGSLGEGHEGEAGRAGSDLTSYVEDDEEGICSDEEEEELSVTEVC